MSPLARWALGTCFWLSEKCVYSPNADEQEKEEARREAERQARLAALSTRGKKIDLESGHLVPLRVPLRSSMRSAM